MIGGDRLTSGNQGIQIRFDEFQGAVWEEGLAPKTETIIVGDFRLGGYQEVINWVGVALVILHRICVLQVGASLDLSVHPVQGDPSQQPSGLLFLVLKLISVFIVILKVACCIYVVLGC